MAIQPSLRFNVLEEFLQQAVPPFDAGLQVHVRHKIPLALDVFTKPTTALSATCG